MADFNTNKREELVIEKVKKGLGFEENEFAKYNVLRIALALALNSPKFSLDSSFWAQKRLNGEKDKEYHLEQITGKGKDKKEDFDLLIRSMLYIKHKEELDRDKKDIFSNEKEYLKILSRYIQRGLYELNNTYKSSDCFYQWCLDNLHLSSKQEEQTKENPKNNDVGYFPKLQDYFKKQGIGIRLVNEEDSYRHHICKIELLDSAKIQAFKTKSQYLDDELGQSIYIEQVKGISRTYSIQIPKQQWQTLGLSELKQGLEVLRKQNFELGVFAGMSVDKKPVCFDLKTAPHLLVGGTSGSGKSKLLKVIVLCLLQTPSVEITIIDPKAGASFSEFSGRENIEILGDVDSANAFVESLAKEMDSRYAAYEQGQSWDNFSYKILIIDEVNDLIMQDKEILLSLKRLGVKGRESKIHIIVASQRPDFNTLGVLRSNLPSQIALKVSKDKESKIILDETGAEKLTGNGDMLIKLSDNSSLQRIIGIYLTEEEIQNQLLVQEIKL